MESQNAGGSTPPEIQTTEAAEDAEHIRPVGTVAVLGLFVVTLILLWLSVYLVLLARGVTT